MLKNPCKCGVSSLKLAANLSKKDRQLSCNPLWASFNNGDCGEKHRGYLSVLSKIILMAAKTLQYNHSIEVAQMGMNELQMQYFQAF